MTITSCPHCNNQLQVEESWDGQQTTCPFCNQQFQIMIAPQVDNVPQQPQMQPQYPPQQPQMQPQYPQNDMYPQNGMYPQQNALGAFIKQVMANADKSKDVITLLLAINWFLLTSYDSVIKFLFYLNRSLFKADVTLVIIAIICLLLSGASLTVSIVTRFRTGIYFSSAALASLLVPAIVEITK